MSDTPIRSQSALELLETHAKALEEENARLREALMDISESCPGTKAARAANDALVERPADETPSVTGESM